MCSGRDGSCCCVLCVVYIVSSYGVFIFVLYMVWRLVRRVLTVGLYYVVEETERVE